MLRSQSFNLERVAVDSAVLGGFLISKRSDGSGWILIKTLSKVQGMPEFTSSYLKINLIAISLATLILHPVVGPVTLMWTFSPTHASGIQPKAPHLSETLV